MPFSTFEAPDSTIITFRPSQVKLSIFSSFICTTVSSRSWPLLRQLTEDEHYNIISVPGRH